MTSLIQTHLSTTTVSIANMDAIIKSNTTRPEKRKELSFRTSGETALLSDESSSMSSCEEEQQQHSDEEPLSRSTRNTLPTTKLPPLVENKRKTSILKPSNEEIPISLKGKPFKHLPPPNLEEIRRNSAITTTATDRPRLSRQHHSVGFSSVVIREYDQTIGDNPSVSYGPPISLDWEYTQLQTVTLEHYEAHRPPRRSMRQMCMNYYTRRNILTFKCGYKEEEVKAASKEADKAKRGRAVTKYLLPYSKVEDFVTSAGRKAKRVVVKSK